MSESVSAKRQRILVPMDFSEAARAALRTALRLARVPGDVVQVFYMPGFYAKTNEEAAVKSNPFCTGAEGAGQRFLAWAEAEGSGVQAETLPQMGIPDAGSVADMAIRMGSTLIVLARRNYTFWK